MDIRIVQAATEQLKEKPADESKLGFGNYFSDHIFLMNYQEGKGWFDARIQPYGDLHLDPAALGLHYAQEVFEGLKAYWGANDGIYLFRPMENMKRMNRSAVRLCMPEIDVELAMEGLRSLIRLDRDWVPKSAGTSLYIRPVLLAIEPHVGVRPSDSYLFYIIISPVGAYYPTGINPVRIHIETEYIRAAAGGIGEAKVAANYATGMLATEIAKKSGYSQVLWLDAVEKKYIEEVGTMNIFFVIDEEVITPPIDGTILPGITRDSVIRITKDWGMKVSERRISVDEVVNGIKDGRMTECFGTGTAAVISPVSEFGYQNEKLVVGDGGMGNLSKRLYDHLVGIQLGNIDDPYDWMEKIV